MSTANGITRRAVAEASRKTRDAERRACKSEEREKEGDSHVTRPLVSAISASGSRADYRAPVRGTRADNEREIIKR